MDHCTITRPPAAPSSIDITSTGQNPPPDGLSCLRNRFAADDLSEEVTDIIMSSWRTGTKKQYSTYIQKWLDFCCERTVACHSPTMNQALLFLRMLFQQGLSYSTINTARSALSTIICLPDGQSFGSHPIVVRFMKCIFELRKPKPKYNSIWDGFKVSGNSYTQ